MASGEGGGAAVPDKVDAPLPPDVTEHIDPVDQTDEADRAEPTDQTEQAGKSEEDAAPEPGARKRAVTWFAAVAGILFLLDLGTKILVVATLADREPIRLLGGAVYLTLTRNSGAAWSIGRDFTVVFPIIAMVVVGVLIWMARRLGSVPWAISLGLILGGVVGNLTDRLFRAPGPFQGHVVDFISVFDPAGQAFPIFNLADSALSCGVVLAILLEFTGRRREGGRYRD